MFCPCYHEESNHDHQESGSSSKVKQVKSLVQLSSDRLLERVIPPKSWAEAGNSFSLEVFCQTEILVQVQKFWLGQLPCTLAQRMLEDANRRYDSQQGIQRLLILYLCLVDNIRSSRLVTPQYLYRWTDGRTMLLERLLEGNALTYCKELSLDMYDFYHKPGTSQTWTSDSEPEFQLDRVRLEKREEMLVQEVLSRLPHLVMLKLRTICTDSMLLIIGETCLCLAQLDLSFARNVTDQGIEHLCRSDTATSRTLRNIQLDGSSITSLGVLLLLESLPNLVSMESSLMEKFLTSMQELYKHSSLFDATKAKGKSNCYSLKSLNLCIRKFSDIRPSITELVSTLFPYLEDIQIHHVHPREVETLLFLKNLHFLKSLMIGGVSLNYIRPGLESMGKNLKTFRYLCYGGHGGKIDLSVISENCRNLECLAISGNCLVSSQDFGGLGGNLFPALTELHINTHAFIPFQIWSSILSFCTNLIQLELTNCEGLWDDSLAQILASHPQSMTKLVKLCIRGGHRGDVSLTERSVDMINSRCRNLIQLGDCFTWSLYGTSGSGRVTTRDLRERDHLVRGLM